MANNYRDNIMTDHAAQIDQERAAREAERQREQAELKLKARAIALGIAQEFADRLNKARPGADVSVKAPEVPDGYIYTPFILVAGKKPMHVDAQVEEQRRRGYSYRHDYRIPDWQIELRYRGRDNDTRHYKMKDGKLNYDKAVATFWEFYDRARAYDEAQKASYAAYEASRDLITAAEASGLPQRAYGRGSWRLTTSPKPNQIAVEFSLSESMTPAEAGVLYATLKEIGLIKEQHVR